MQEFLFKIHFIGICDSIKQKTQQPWSTVPREAKEEYMAKLHAMGTDT